MPTISYEIDNYAVFHLNAQWANQSAIILLYRPPPDNGAPCAYLIFYRDGTTIPDSRNDEGLLVLNYHENQLADVTETLRREEPLTVLYFTSSRHGYLFTGREPIGEEELP